MWFEVPGGHNTHKKCNNPCAYHSHIQMLSRMYVVRSKVRLKSKYFIRIMMSTVRLENHL